MNDACVELLLQKLDDVQTKIDSIIKDNEDLRKMVKSLYEQNYKLVKDKRETEEKEHK